jgi:hypothetical protein
MSVPSAARAALTFSSWFVFVGLAVCAALAMPSPAEAAVCPPGRAAITVQNVMLVGLAGPRNPSSMRGNVNQGDTVVVNFTVNAACTAGVEVSLVSYFAPGPTWDPNTASQQQVFNSQTETFTPGPNSIGPVTVPVGCFQIDFVRGAVIYPFSPPSGTYSAQNRLIDFDNGDPGCTPLV